MNSGDTLLDEDNSTEENVGEANYKDYLGKLEEREKKQKIRSDMYQKSWALESITSDAIFAQGDFESTTVEERKKIVKASAESFVSEILKLEFTAPAEAKPEAEPTSEETEEQITFTESINTNLKLLSNLPLEEQ